MSDKYNDKIKSLIESALKKESGYNLTAMVYQTADCTALECIIIVTPWYDRHPEPNKKAAQLWINSSREEIINMINSCTNMVWEAPEKPEEYNWKLKKGCVHWSAFTGNRNGDGSDGDEIDEFLVFEDGEFSVSVGYVNGEKTDGVDISSYAEEDDFEFCEEPNV